MEPLKTDPLKPIVSDTIDVLNGGFVQLVDVMGDDKTVVNAARLSYNGHSEELTEKDKKLINFLAKHKHWTPFGQPQLQFRLKVDIATARQLMRHCYSSDTEVLTPDGWVLFSNLTPTTKVAQVTEDNKHFEFLIPSEYIVEQYDGDMHLYQSKSVSLCVTPKHRMVVEKRHKKMGGDVFTSHVITSEQLREGGEYRLPKLPSYSFNNEGTDDDFREGQLYGFYIGDGCSSSSPSRMTFGLRKSRKVEYLKEILQFFGGFHCLEVFRQGYTVIHIDNPDTSLFSGAGTKNTKLLDLSWVLQSRKRAEGVLDGLINSDGTVTKGGSIRFSTSQEPLVEQIRRLTTFLGLDTSYHIHRRESDKQRPGHVVTLSKNRPKYLKEMQTISYSGKVYCVTVPSGKLLVRREGKQAICGNCVGIVYNEKSGRYCEMGEAEMYLPLEFRTQAVSNRQASTDEIVEDIHGRLPTIVAEHYENSRRLYQRLRHEGVCKEQARLVLPVATFTEIYCTMSLAALARIVGLRNKPDAQYEIRQYVKAMLELGLRHFPVSLEALTSDAS